MQRQMLAWLHGPGAVFEQPLKGSTNYLGAYDKSGALIRGRAGATGGGQQGQEGGESQESKSDSRAGGGEKGALPPETVEDLRPFPLNPYFRSEAVLSDDLRNEIYRRIKDQGQTVREVSVSLSVTMERCAAVYRMKEIEKRRVAEVCSFCPSPNGIFGPSATMRHNKNSISLQDLYINMVTIVTIPEPEKVSQIHWRQSVWQNM